VCRILLPPNARIREVISPVCSTKKRAKQEAALIACRRLYELRALNDFLLPTMRDDLWKSHIEIAAGVRYTCRACIITRWSMRHGHAQDGQALSLWILVLSPEPQGEAAVVNQEWTKQQGSYRMLSAEGIANQGPVNMTAGVWPALAR
jgi:hypothetical protein